MAFTTSNGPATLVVTRIAPEGTALSLLGGIEGTAGQLDDVRFSVTSDQEGRGVPRLTRG